MAGDQWGLRRLAVLWVVATLVGVAIMILALRLADRLPTLALVLGLAWIAAVYVSVFAVGWRRLSPRQHSDSSEEPTR